MYTVMTFDSMGVDGKHNRCELLRRSDDKFFPILISKTQFTA